LGDISLGFGYLIDSHARLMLFVVSFVAAWIHLFSIGYMKEDEAGGRFFAGLSIFMFSILGIVIADNLLMTFIFWELVGFSSYMLIAHYFDTEFAAEASKKAFITNRVGDLGFILGIALCLKLFGTLNFTELKATSRLNSSYCRRIFTDVWVSRKVCTISSTCLADRCNGWTDTSIGLYSRCNDGGSRCLFYGES
jgi:NADH-quinone oxidoreductase subunit L